MREALLIVSGMLLMYIILNIMARSEETNSDTWKAIKDLLKLQQTTNLVRTNEFRELVKTQEFRNVVGTLAKNELTEISKTLIG